MTDRLFFSLAALAAMVMVALALAWPQGLGARGPWPFGHETEAERIVRTAPKPAPVNASLARLKGGL